MKAGNRAEAFTYFGKAKQLRDRLYAVDGKNWRLASHLVSSYTQWPRSLEFGQSKQVTAPDSSITVPEMLPVGACAKQQTQRISRTMDRRIHPP